MPDAHGLPRTLRAAALIVIVAMLGGCAGTASRSPSQSATSASAEPSASPDTSSEATPRTTPSPKIFDLEGTWADGAPMPVSRAEVAATVLDGRLYVAGGLDARANSLTTFEAYDPISNTWTELAPIPEGRDHPGLAALDSKIYLTGGGILGAPAVKREAWVYDPAANAWSSIAPLPARRWAHVSLGLGGKVFVFGGVVASEPTNADTWAYDPATDTWDASVPPLPTYREHLAGVVVDGKAWIIGGRHFSNLPTVEVYDPVTNAWTAMPDRPTASGGLTAALVGRQIHVSGGENLEDGSTYGQHDVFDLDLSRWLTAPDLPKKRHGLGSGAIDGRWIVVGGGQHAGLAVSPYVDIFTPAP